jgi:UDP-N-acetyl-D-galactosamine dehydrogenase
MKSKAGKIRNRETRMAVVGMGYVGLPLAVAFAGVADVVGFDISRSRIALLKKDIDPSDELSSKELSAVKINYTADPRDLKKCRFIIVAVPTPIDKHKQPDLTPVIKASETVGKNMARGSIVVYESTVYPGVTDDICAPILERASGFKRGRDFRLGYSPERINPGDKEHTVDKIVKIVSGEDRETLETVAAVYSMIITAGVHRASSIRVAEAAKVIENCQRDLNIAFVNELALIFNKLGIDTGEVLEAAGTKWNFLKFQPGLVGGHCIGVDPYYLTFKAQEVGHSPQVILSGRRINDGMGRWIARSLVKMLIDNDRKVRHSRTVIFGLTFKENVSDLRNSKVRDIIDELKEFGIRVVVHDPMVNSKKAEKEFGVRLVQRKEIKKCDAIIFAVAHDKFKTLSPGDLKNMVTGKNAPFFDIKGMWDRETLVKAGFSYWRL